MMRIAETTSACRLMICGTLLACCYGCSPAAETTQAAEQAATDIVAGSSAYVASCASCHGFDGEGLPGLGTPLQSNPAISDQTEGQLVEFLKAGRSQDDPLNTSGIEMPPRGGTDLDDAELRNIAAYLLTISGP